MVLMKKIMNKRILFPTVFFVCLMTMFFVSCKKPQKTVDFAFTAKMEQLSIDDSTQKNYLSKEEVYIRWEEGDAIGIDYNPGKAFTLFEGAGTDDAGFTGTYKDNGETDRHAIYPYSSMLDDDITTLSFPAEQVYRAGDAKYDSSFGINSFPMVATFKNGSDFVLFHSVCAIMRIQLFAQELTALESIVFKEVTPSGYKQISGTFNIHDIDKYEPYLSATKTSSNVTEAERTITISGIDKSIGPNTLLTFYLVLPALGQSTTTNYRLQMTVTNKSGGTFTRVLGGNTARNRITPIPALCISSWDGTNTNSINLVGSGTKERPFLIYDAGELQMVKTAFDSDGDVIINGQTVTESTYFRVVRTDIELTTENWPAGIKNFTGIMEGATNQPIEFGVTNKSNAPVFESVSSNGIVRFFHVQSTGSVQTYTGSAKDFSPLCNVNNGVIQDCHNHCKYSTSKANMAAICVTNNGRIIRCQNAGNLTATGKNLAGICLYNETAGTIKECVGLASTKYSSTRFGGITFNNKGIVRDCIMSFSNNVDSSNVSGCGSISFKNAATGKINLCRITGDLCMGNNDDIGGVADTNYGTIDSCFLAESISLLKGGRVGGIVVVNKGTVRNCYVSSRIFSSSISDGGYGGGLVGYLDGGVIENCYSACNITGSKIASIVSYAISGNVKNCYTYGSGETYGKIYFIEKNTAVFESCYTSNTDLPEKTGCIAFDYKTGRLSDGTAFLLDELNTWVSTKGSSYATWNTVVLPRFNY